jgi:hypothetical protein
MPPAVVTGRLPDIPRPLHISGHPVQGHTSTPLREPRPIRPSAADRKAGRRGAVPLIVLDQAGRTVTTKSLTADVSFDDGTTWRKAPITNGAAQVSYPSGKGFVSLRLHATDAAGTTFDQSVIRAYRFG